MFNCMEQELKNIFGEFDHCFAEDKKTFIVRGSNVFQILPDQGLLFSGNYLKDQGGWVPSGTRAVKLLNF